MCKEILTESLPQYELIGVHIMMKIRISYDFYIEKRSNLFELFLSTYSKYMIN